MGRAFADRLGRQFSQPDRTGSVAGSLQLLRGRFRLGVLRTTVLLGLGLVAVALLCGISGYLLARQSGEQRDFARRQALVAAIKDYRASGADDAPLDGRIIGLLEQTSGLKGLRFDAGLGTRSRELQPVLEGGRIVGWLSWDRDALAVNAVTRLWPLVLLALLCLSGLIALLLRHRHDERQALRRDLKRAVAARAFGVEYQPIVAANGYRIVGVEALLRWNHPDRGAIAPADFIPLAERGGLMDELGDFVLRRALADAARWRQLHLAINLSPLQLRDHERVNRIAHLIRNSGTAPERVVLEITEGVLIEEPERIKTHLERLRAMGIRIALDDFGSGYSSLSYLRQFPIDKLKIDRGFVAPLGRSGNAGVIIQAIVTLGRALGLSVLVEGVETDEQRVLLRLAGCDEMQGVLFGRSLPPTGIDRLLAQTKRFPQVAAEA